ncbi:hypothetical protein EDC96DRAFT_567680 [Choanephora cucurbitarum]|nr:hypothetical protein EDC96DRAFT_567680 [Choanephora cucurbitarum]
MELADTTKVAVFVQKMSYKVAIQKVPKVLTMSSLVKNEKKNHCRRVRLLLLQAQRADAGDALSDEAFHRFTRCDCKVALLDYNQLGELILRQNNRSVKCDHFIQKIVRFKQCDLIRIGSILCSTKPEDILSPTQSGPLWAIFQTIRRVALNIGSGVLRVPILFLSAILKRLELLVIFKLTFHSCLLIKGGEKQIMSIHLLQLEIKKALRFSKHFATVYQQERKAEIRKQSHKSR